MSGPGEFVLPLYPKSQLGMQSHVSQKDHQDPPLLFSSGKLGSEIFECLMKNIAKIAPQGRARFVF